MLRQTAIDGSPMGMKRERGRCSITVHPTAAAPATVSGERRSLHATGQADYSAPGKAGPPALTREPGDLPSMSSPVRARGAVGTRVLRLVTTERNRLASGGTV
jgi:hypothetical protein